MKYIIISIGLIFLFSACSRVTPQDLRLGVPLNTYTSEKSPKEVAICIANYWENNIIAPLASIDVDVKMQLNGYSAQAKIDGHVSYLADIEEYKKGSRTTFYSPGISIGRNTSVDAVGVCQQ